MTDKERDDLIQAIAHRLCPHVVQEGPCSGCSLGDKGPNGGVRGCIHDATKVARWVFEEIEAKGHRVVFFDAPKVPAFLAPVTLTRGCAVCGIDFGLGPWSYACGHPKCPIAARCTS